MAQNDTLTRTRIRVENEGKSNQINKQNKLRANLFLRVDISGLVLLFAFCQVFNKFGCGLGNIYLLVRKWWELVFISSIRKY